MTDIYGYEEISAHDVEQGDVIWLNAKLYTIAKVYDRRCTALGVVVDVLLNSIVHNAESLVTLEGSIRRRVKKTELLTLEEFVEKLAAKVENLEAICKEAQSAFLGTKKGRSKATPYPRMEKARDIKVGAWIRIAGVDAMVDMVRCNEQSMVTFKLVRKFEPDMSLKLNENVILEVISQH